MRYIWSTMAQTWVRALPPRGTGYVAIISDTQEPLLHPVTGQLYDSKSQFRAATRAAGCVELGNDAPVATQRPEIDRQQLRNDIGEAMAQLEAGREPPRAPGIVGTVRRYG